MIVMVEHEEVTGQLNRKGAHDSGLPSPTNRGAANSRFTNDKLYSEYLRREGRSPTVEGSQVSRQSSGRDREHRNAENSFKDF